MRKLSARAPAIVLAASLCWLAALGLAPVVRAHAASWPAPVRAAAGLAYVAGSRVCHQRPERSFHLAGAPLPVCARCTGLYVGAGLGLLAVVAGASLSRRLDAARPLLMLAALPTACSVVLDWLGLDAPLEIRTLAAVPLGAVVAALVGTWLHARGREDGPRATPAGTGALLHYRESRGPDARTRQDETPSTDARYDRR